METVVVLAMHGAPPLDFPRQELGEFFGLRGRMERAGVEERAALRARHEELEGRMRAWPRTPANDPFHAASHELARDLAEAAGLEVLVGFNEFCAPSLDEALDEAAARRPAQVIVVTPMMTRGGEHAEKDIPATIAAAAERHPEVRFAYAWPFDSGEVAAFLAKQVQRLL